MRKYEKNKNKQYKNVTAKKRKSTTFFHKNTEKRYRISSNKGRVSNKRRTLGYPHWNKRLLSNKRRTSKCGAYQNSYYILLETKPKCIWN